MTPTPLPEREAALALLYEHTQGESLRSHALAVEAAMRAVARDRGEDEQLFALTGLLHDLDYERWPDPDEHARRGAAILAEHGYPAVLTQAILAHNDRHGVPRESLLAKALYAVDELCGFVIACGLVRPGRSIATLEPRSVLKKLKDKAFARQVDRDSIRRGAAELELPLEELVLLVIAALRPVAPALGLTA